MGHDAHFLQRLDRVSHEHVELALGLYRDAELVAAILADTRVPADAPRVALALADGGGGPHVVVARDGAFVTCLGTGMSAGTLPVVSRAHIDGLATRVERVRERLALARRHGVDQAELLRRFSNVGPRVSREDFLSASAVIGPAAPLLLGTYLSWAGLLHEMYPILYSRQVRSWDAARRRRSEEDLARGAWAMAHSAMLLADTVTREWVDGWAREEVHDTMSPWTLMTQTSAFPFVLRAAWIVARLGKPMLPIYKARFARPHDAFDLRETGWALACLGLRHASIRGEALRTLSNPPDHDEIWAKESFQMFRETARLLDEKEESLRAEALDLGRKLAAARQRGMKPEDVRDDLVLPSLFDACVDANNDERGPDVMLLGVVAAARARAEDFYLPASAFAAHETMTLQEAGASLVDMRRVTAMLPKPARTEAKTGRNDPCHCGSGKKYKKCHGA